MKTSDRTHPVAIFDDYWATTLAFARSLGRKGVPLHFYGRGAGRWSRYRKRRGSCPPVTKADEFCPWFKEKIGSGEISRVAPTTDLIAFYTSSVRHLFSAEVQRTIAPLDEIENCLIKTRFAQASQIAGRPSLAVIAPDSVEAAASAASTLGYPVIIKPKSHLAVGFEERGRVLHSYEDVVRYFKRYAVAPGQDHVAAEYPELRWPLMQRYLKSARNRVYSVSGIKDADGGVLAATVSYKCEQWPPDVGVSTKQVGIEDERVLKSGLEIVNHVLSRGIFEVELLVEGDELYAIDLNPRSFGFIELDMARGADLPWLWFRSTLAPLRPDGVALKKTPMQARHRLMHLLRALTRPRHSNGQSEKTPSVSMVGHWSDPLPMIISNMQFLRHPRSFFRSQLALTRAARSGTPELKEI